MTYSWDIKVGDMFSYHSFTGRIGHFRPVSKVRNMFMEIPFGEEVFELPAFALQYYYNFLQNPIVEADKIVLSLYQSDYKTQYVSTETGLYYVSAYASDNGLILMYVKNKDTQTKFYVNKGAIFNENLLPLVMCSWVLNKEHEEGWRAMQPIMRISPECFLHKNTAVERLIVGKILNAALTKYVYAPDFCTNTDCLLPIKVEIAGCPFTIHGTPNPSVLTTNEELLQLATDHIEEIVQ